MHDNRISLLEKKISQLEKDLESSRGMLNSAKSIIIRYDPKGNIRYINEYGLKFFGYSREELIGRSVMTIVPKQEKSTGRDLEILVKDILKKPAHYMSVSNENVTKDGRVVWVTWSNEALLDEQGNMSEILAIGNDITELKKAEEGLREAHNFNELIIEKSPVGILVFKESGPCISANPAAEVIAGASCEELLNLNYKHMESYKKTGILADIEDILSGGDNSHREIHTINTFGKEVWFEQSLSSFEMNNEKHILFFFKDIKQRKQAEALLVKQKKLLDETQELAKIGGWEFDVSNDLMTWTDGVYKIYEMARTEYFPNDIKRDFSFYNPEDRAQIEQVFRRAVHEGKSYDLEVRVTTAKGNQRWVRTVGQAERKDGKVIRVFGNILDITERKELEMSLVRAKEQWEATFDAITDWVAIIDENFHVIRSNKACQHLADLPVKEVIGQRCYQVIHGTDCPVDDCPGRRTFLSKHRESMEIQMADGRWLWITVEPIKGAFSDAGQHYVHIVRDVSEQKQRQKELIAVRKAEAFGILSGGIAHDYNNLLAIIWGNLSLANEKIENPTALELLEAAEVACKSARDLTHKFITLAEGAEVQKAQTDINDVLTAALEGAKPEEHHEVAIDWITDHFMIEAEAQLLILALRNILTNAVEAMSGGGKLQITVEAISRHSRDLEKELKLTIADTGKGISHDDLHNVFDPYFTTKRKGTQKGLGLGLAVSRSIIKKHGGQIQIDSTPGQGTVVDVFLPLSSKAGLLKELPETLTHPVVLLMEDDPNLKKTITAMLASMNCTVLAATHGQEAIEIYQGADRSHQSIDLVLLDQAIQAGIGGIKTLEKLRKLGYANKALVISGSPSSPAITNFREYGFDGTIVKPFTLKEMKTVLSQHIPMNTDKQ